MMTSLFFLVFQMFSWSYTSNSGAADCGIVTYPGAPYIKCVIRGEAAKLIVSQSHEAFRVYSIDYGKGVRAWEMIGQDIECAARTETSEGMRSFDLLMENLASAEAICRYFINPATGEVSLVPDPRESAAGVSNDFE